MTWKVLLCCLIVACYLGVTSEQATNDIEPDVYRNVSQLLTSKGYPVEEYELKTPDGYIVGIQRIPHGVNGRGQDSGQAKPVVFLQHGLTSLSDDWVINMPDQSLGFILADSGYDVWLGNVRGNKYSRKHATLSPDDRAFWEFSLDELSLNDLPVILDFILKVTGETQLFYVGHSMGTTMAMALLANKPEYNDKIRVAIMMGPSALLSHSRNIPNSQIVKLFLTDLFDHGEMKAQNTIAEYLLELFCNKEVQLCDNLYFSLCGMSIQQLNQTRIPVYIANHPSAASVRCMQHYLQLKDTGIFQRFDYGEKGNIAKYNQSTPPEYPLEKITAPTVLMWGLNDAITDPVDVNLLAPRLGNLLLNYQVPYPEWSHVDFSLGLDAKKYVYDMILQIFKNHLTK